MALLDLAAVKPHKWTLTVPDLTDAQQSHCPLYSFFASCASYVSCVSYVSSSSCPSSSSVWQHFQFQTPDISNY